ncbi:PGRS family protein (plasmid) [Sorangium sp. So ce119]|uniref:PGRS family protein n=1 Tax=Sorangium sp. So ce119 TaxID=3133279 RepID=UPI003F62C6FF
MRRRAHLASIVFLTAMAMGASHAGCIDFPFPQGDSNEKYSGAPVENPTPEGCDPSDPATWTAAETCGVFVSDGQGDDDNDGTSQMPVKSLARALILAEARSKPVYACREEFDGAVEVPAGTTLYGGLTCDKGEDGLVWQWVDDKTRTTITAPAGTIPLKITGGNSQKVVHLENVDVIARSIPQDDSAEPGMSSIAAVAESVSRVELRHCTLEAGDAAPGFDGEAYEKLASAGANGNPGKNACEGSTVVGGDAAINDCGTPEDTDDSIGGAGGAGRHASGDPGVSGYPEVAMNGGLGQVGAASCAPGIAGENGSDGQPGSGAKDDGSISSEGYIGVSGGPGAPGTTAQGGGGGGGARGVPTTPTSPPRSCADGTPPLGGASGGSGGAGGCGGAGGRGGGPGGASIALISIRSGLSFDDVTIKTGNGGKGGDGGPGQDGGMGGMGGPRGEAPRDSTSNLLHGCDGGPGGTGGKGGPGGGGRGGHSIGIAFQGAAPVLQGVTFELGAAGLGGSIEEAHAGANGEKADRLPL